MKNGYLYLALLILTACNSDLEKVHYNASEAKAAVLQSIDESYVLDAQESDLTAIEFVWSNPVLNYPAAVTTDLQMDLGGHHFGGAVTLASSKTDSTYAITTADLNAALLKLQAQYGLEFGPMPIDFRLVSSISVAAPSLYSNVVSTTLTPFAGEREYPQICLDDDAGQYHLCGGSDCCGRSAARHCGGAHHFPHVASPADRNGDRGKDQQLRSQRK